MRSIVQALIEAGVPLHELESRLDWGDNMLHDRLEPGYRYHPEQMEPFARLFLIQLCKGNFEAAASIAARAQLATEERDMLDVTAPDCPLAVTQLHHTRRGKRIVGILEAQGYDTVGDVSSTPDEVLLAVPAVGRGILEEIRRHIPFNGDEE